jgi:hypothetical protein
MNKPEINLKINKMIDPDVYFRQLKDSSQNINLNDLEKLKEILNIKKRETYLTRQDQLLRRLDFTYQVVLKEIDLIQKWGITKAISYENLKTGINNIEGKAIKIVELRNYIRDIPKEVINLIHKLKEAKVFDEYYIVFTDYTTETSKVVEKERQKKDPILFGAFLDDKIKGNLGIHERLYFLADWEDEYCNLTYDKLLQANIKKGYDFNIDLVKNINEKHIDKYINKLIEQDNNRNWSNKVDEKSLFSKFKSFFGLDK